MIILSLLSLALTSNQTIAMKVCMLERLTRSLLAVEHRKIYFGRRAHNFYENHADFAYIVKVRQPNWHKECERDSDVCNQSKRVGADLALSFQCVFQFKRACLPFIHYTAAADPYMLETHGASYHQVPRSHGWWCTQKASQKTYDANLRAARPTFRSK